MNELPIKNEFASGLLELSRLAVTKYATASQCLSEKPCWLLCCVITPDAPENGSIAYLRNGETVNAEILFNFQGQYAHPTHCSVVPIYFNRGLYFEKSTNCKGITIQYLVDSP